MTRFRGAIVRPPSANFGEGLTTASLGRPDFGLALKQHQQYCAALEHCDLSVLRLPPDERFPDATFIEDTCVLTPRRAILSNPGAPSREGEVGTIEDAVADIFPGALDRISPPGTLDGGDVCEAGGSWLIGISARTNEEGARQLASLLSASGCASEVIDIRRIPGILHLKSDLAYLGEGRLFVTERLRRSHAWGQHELIGVPVGEEYAANLIRVNDAVLAADGFPRTRRILRDIGYSVVTLEVSEFQKMDGGLSCLSLRF